MIGFATTDCEEDLRRRYSVATWVGILLLAVPITVMTSHVTLGERMRSLGVLLIPEESWSPAVLRRAWRHAARLALPQAA